MPDSGWVPISNDAVRDHRLSWRARGLLAELLSYPDGWDTTVEKLVAQAKREGGKAEGRDAMLKAMAELKKTGYVVYRRSQAEGGIFTTEMVVCDVPCSPDRGDQGPEVQVVGELPEPNVTDVLKFRVSVPPADSGVFPGRTDTLKDRPPGFQGVLKKTDYEDVFEDEEDQDQKIPLPTLWAGPLPTGHDESEVSIDDYWAAIDRGLLGAPIGSSKVKSAPTTKSNTRPLKEHQP